MVVAPVCSTHTPIAVLGAGAWGTALAINFAQRHPVRLWSWQADEAETLARERVNCRYLPNAPFPSELSCSSDLAATLRGAQLVVVATPVAGLRSTLQAVVASGERITGVLWACKGFEQGSAKLPHQVVSEVLPAEIPRGVLSGPSFAKEVAQGLPAAITLAANDEGFAQAAARCLHTTRLRLYFSTDVIGVEIGAAVKNVLAIAAGIADGLGLGYNARAALLTRGLAEMTRLGVALGGMPETFLGLSGAGDLILTCTGDLSRNRTVGLKLAEGRKLNDILHTLGHVAEGVPAAREVWHLSQQASVAMPISHAVYRVLYEEWPVAAAVEDLLDRAPKRESDGWRKP